MNLSMFCLSFPFDILRVRCRIVWVCISKLDCFLMFYLDIIFIKQHKSCRLDDFLVINIRSCNKTIFAYIFVLELSMIFSTFNFYTLFWN